MEKLSAKWNALKPWQRYAVVGVIGLILGAIAASFGSPAVAA